MAANVDEEIDGNVDTEGMGTAPPADGQNDTSDTGNGQSGISRTTRLLIMNLGRLLLHLVCLSYSLYLIWLLAYLKDNNNYWFLSFIPLLCNVLPFLLLYKAYHDNEFPEIEEGTFMMYQPSYGVVVNLHDGLLYNANSPSLLPPPAGRVRWTTIYYPFFASKHYSDFTRLCPTESKKTG